MRARTILLLACALPLIAAAAPFQDALKPTGVQAEHIHSLWEIMLWTCTAVFIAVVGACGLALWRAPRATENTPADAAVSKAPERPLMRAVVISSTISIAGLVAL